MNLTIRGWQRSRNMQNVFSREIIKIEHRNDGINIPSGNTSGKQYGIVISFLGKASCSAQGNYNFDIGLNDSDIAELIRRRCIDLAIDYDQYLKIY
jgi:hypothetical protein